MVPQPADCPRVPAAEVRPADAAQSLTSQHLRDAARMVEAAYPGRSLYYDASRNSLYVIEGGQAYEARVGFDRDDASGYAALALTFASQHSAALRAGEALDSRLCRSGVEVVVARMGESGVATIVSRAPIDAEAVAIDVRTLTVRQDFDRSVGVQLFYHAYYRAADWFGFVTYRSEVVIEATRLVTHRLPAGYLRVSRPARRQEGMLGPAGQRREGFLLFTAASMEKGTYEEIEVPIVGVGSMSGIEILRRVP